MLFKYLFLFFLAFSLNFLLGIGRRKAKKYSLPWFIFIHASIPVLYLLRTYWQISPFFIAPVLLLALAGQFLGGRLRKNEVI